MLTAVIADDEKKVSQLILNLVNWNEIGIKIIGIANDGESAYTLILEKEPNIVITDIRMPGFNGIELVKKVKEIGLSTNFIIISGYRHFEYAHKALKYGVVEYLLKPIKKEELKSALETIKNKMMSYYHGKINHYIKNTIFYPEKACDIILEDIRHSNFQGDNNMLIILKIDDVENTQEIIITDKVLEKIVKITENNLNIATNNVYSYIINSGVICVINFKDEIKKETLYKCIEDLFDNVEEYLDFFQSLSLTIGLAGYNTISDIPVVIEEVFDAIIARIFLGTNRIINVEEMNNNRFNILDILGRRRENNLKNLIETLDKEGIEALLADIFNDLEEIANLSPRAIIEVCRNIVDLFIQNIKRFGVEAKKARELKELISIKMDRALCLAVIYEELLNFMVKQIDIIYNRKKQEDNKPIREVKSYIQEHYMEKVALTNLARLVHLNPDYLSAMFKKEVGINFSEYLINIRMDKAKDLLINSEKTISLIADEVGYTDRRYFSKLFTNTIGIKPSEYRKLYF